MSTITAKRLRQLLDYDPATGVFRWKITRGGMSPCGAVAGSRGRRRGERERRTITVEGRIYFADCLAWLHVHGRWPVGQIEHRNASLDDNRIDNLRSVQPGKLTAARLRELLDYDLETGVFRWRASRKGVPLTLLAGRLDGKGYWRICIDHRAYAAHRLAWLYVYGCWPAHEIDHRNGIRDDNRIINLREATINQNRHNSVARNPLSGLKGAHWQPKDRKWRAQIAVNSRSIHLGQFNTREEAHMTYCVAAIIHHGDFAGIPERQRRTLTPLLRDVSFVGIRFNPRDLHRGFYTWLAQTHCR